MTVITAHQPNLLPGASVLGKLLVADAVIWLDEVQFTKGGFTNRQHFPDGSRFTVPVERHCAFKPINRVRIGAPPARDWRERLTVALLNTWPGPVTGAVCAELERPYRLLVGLNVALLRILLGALGCTAQWHFQSHLDGGHAVVAQSDDQAQLLPISERLAMMVDELGGTSYLSGPSGRRYLDETPFRDRGITVAYWTHQGPNPCALELVDQTEAVPA